MNAGTVTQSNGGDIGYTANGGDVTIGTLSTCADDDCTDVADTGAVTIIASNDILGQAGQVHVTAVSASLTSNGGIGQNPLEGGTEIEFNGMPTVGTPITLLFNAPTAYINTNLSGFTATGGNVIDSFSTVLGAVAESQAAGQGDEEDVDWAAFSEEVTVYEINNNGVQLPQTEEIDEFAKLLDEALRNLAEEKETVTDVVSIFNSMPLPEGIPVSQLIEPR